MRNASMLVLCFLMCLASAAGSGARGQAAAPTSAAGSGSTHNTIEVGFEQRVRSEDWDNIVDHDRAALDQRIQYRFRTRLWTRLDYRRLELGVGWNTENRKIVRPETDFAWDEIVFETLYLGYHMRNGLEMHIGRQNLMRGDGFVLFDGSALDGSRTMYFNAASVTLDRGKSRLELLGISDPRTDSYLPRIHDKDKPLTDWDERALGAIFTNMRFAGTSLGAYWFYKTETGDTRVPAKAQPDRRLHTLGGNGWHEFAGGWRFDGEMALQVGRSELFPGEAGAFHDILAWGGQGRIKRKFDVTAKPSLSLGYIALSGDDPTTHHIEGWDPLFSRWPKGSELYIHAQIPEKGVAYWTDLGMLQAELLCAPAPWLGLRATYYRLHAFETFPGGTLFGTGHNRGDLYQVRGDVAVGPHWKGHVLLEYLDPGDFYAGQEGGYFLRFEVIYGYKQLFPLGSGT